MALNWDLERSAIGAVFTLSGYLSDDDVDRLEGATGWVAGKTDAVVLDLSALQGCSLRAQRVLGRFVVGLAPRVVVCGASPNRLPLHDTSFFGIPRAKTRAAALTTLNAIPPREWLSVAP